jgi:hypothetical protein
MIGSDTTSILFLALLAVQAVGTAIYLFYVKRLFSCLEANEPGAFESLGSPHLILNNTLRTNWLLLRWLWRKDFLSLSHREARYLATRVHAWARVLLVNSMALLLVFAAIFANAPRVT